MGNNVFANGREIACKAADGKAICAFPDVCFTPPQTPATPPGVPIPYPNTAFAKDTTKGSKKVKISGKPVMLKNKSHFKTSTGDEAGSAPKKGVITSKTKGKVYFNMWSMDVKFEGQNVVRHLDLTTHNHGSTPPNSPTWPYLDMMAFDGSGEGPCKDVAQEVNDECADKLVPKQSKKGEFHRKASMDKMCDKGKCEEAMKCVISPYSPNNCCPDENGDQPTPHHVVLKSQFKEPGEGGSPLLTDSSGNDRYKANKAPCICLDGESHSVGTHGEVHSATNKKTRKAVGVEPNKKIPDDKRWKVSEAESIGSEAVEEATGCPAACIEEQVRKAHDEMKISKEDEIRPTTAGGEEAEVTQTGSGLP